MTADLLLKHFHRLGGTAEAVPQLRELVLQLATGGKLTDYPKQSIHGHELHQLASFIMGQAPPGSECNDQGIGTLFVKVGEFGERYPEARAWTTKPLKFAEEGDVLICVVGATVGKLNLGVHCAIGRSVAAIRPKHDLDTLFLYYSLMPFTLRLRKDARGSAQGVISKGDLACLKVWCPPLPEQHRIVAKVEELMALCDRLEAEQQAREAHRTRLGAAAWHQVVEEPGPEPVRFALQHLPALTARADQVQALRQTILDLAVRGRLVPQDERDEPAEVLLERISVEQKRLFKEGSAKWQKATAGPQCIEPAELPTGWAWICLKELGSLSGGMTPSKARRDFWGGSVNWLSSADIKKPELNESGLKITEKALQETNLIHYPPGCLVMVVRSGILKHTLPVSIIRSKTTVNQDLKVLQPYLPGMERFIQLMLWGFNGFIIEELVKQGTTVQSVKFDEFVSQRFPLPPLAEQRRIVAKVDELMALCDALEAALREGETLKAKALEAVLHVEATPSAPARPAARAYTVPRAPLPLAAEPATRRRGRPRKTEAVQDGAATHAILAFLQAHPGLHGKAAILEGSGIAANAWNAAIKALVEEGKVRREGEKKGARYGSSPDA